MKINGVETPDTDKKPGSTVPRFGTVRFSVPDKAKVYDSRFGGGKNTLLVEATVPLPFVGLNVKCSMYERMTDKGGDIMFDCDASLPGKGAVSGITDTDRNRILAHVEQSFVAWPEGEKVREAAQLRLQEIPADPKDTPAELIRPKMAVRLVKKAQDAPKS